jgi:hypothetical protein
VNILEQANLIIANWAAPKWVAVEDEPVRGRNGAFYPYCLQCRANLEATGFMVQCGDEAEHVASH